MKFFSIDHLFSIFISGLLTFQFFSDEKYSKYLAVFLLIYGFVGLMNKVNLILDKINSQKQR